MSIEIEEITKKYGAQLALDGVSFKVKSGEILGFLGPNGAGKSTLMKILTGYIAPDSGIARIAGLKVEADKTDFRSRIGYLPENNPLYPEMYIREYLTMVAGFYKLKNAKAKIENVIEITGLTPESGKKIGALSKGYKQRVGLAQALIHNPDVLILDEPTTGLDPNQLDEIRNLIVEISRDKTVMLSTHIMQEVEAICSRIIIIDKGNLVANGTPEEINKISKGVGQQVVVEVKTKDEADVKAVIEEMPFVAKVDVLELGKLILTAGVEEDIRPLFFNEAVNKGWIILTMQEQQQSVENIFRELTNV